MLFNSYQFIFLFLPVTLIVFYFFGGAGKTRLAIYWLFIASLFFYACWKPVYLLLILFSMTVNYAVGYGLGRYYGVSVFRRKFLLVLGLLFNLGLLGYFKYTNFFIGNINYIFDLQMPNWDILLPLGISFFTFQEIAYLVDAYQGKTRAYGYVNFSLFVVFFPQLIAGPIVHYKEVMPQFAKDRYVFSGRDFAIAITFFSIGLFKKVILADNLALHASPVFTAVKEGAYVTSIAAWTGALCYAFQIYFDFSGYSDMAIGLGRFFGIRLPHNFNSPYKATGFIEFWRRWHVTLSRFLRDYLYIPLGGNRKGPLRRYVNLIIVMLLGGLWHGANWAFVLWGACHGAGLVINHGWRAMVERFGLVWTRSCLFEWVARVFTFVFVVFAWVFFRSEDVHASRRFFESMFGCVQGQVAGVGGDIYGAAYIILAFLIVWLLPNSQEFMRKYRPTIDFRPQEHEPFLGRMKWLVWRPHTIWAVVIGIVFLVSIFNMLKVSEFLYFQF